MMQKKILIIAPSWVGDMMMAQSLMISLKQQNSDVVIDVLAPAWTQALTSRMPEVSEVIISPFKHGNFGLISRLKLGRKLKKNQYQAAYILPNSFKSALVPFFARIPKRIGWCGEARFGLLNNLRFLDKTAYPLMVQRFSALAYPAKADLGKVIHHPKLSIPASQVKSTLDYFDINPSQLETQKIIAICPGAEFGPSKRWPKEHFSALIQQLSKNGWTIWLFGSEKDKNIGNYILEHNLEQTEPFCVNFIGNTSLDQAIDLLSVVNCVVTNDSGLMHIACALSKPVVAIYGSTSTNFTPPLGEKLEIIQLTLPCSPCFKRTCPLGHHQCMQDIKPDRVMASVNKLCAS